MTMRSVALIHVPSVWPPDQHDSGIYFEKLPVQRAAAIAKRAVDAVAVLSEAVCPGASCDHCAFARWEH